MKKKLILLNIASLLILVIGFLIIPNLKVSAQALTTKTIKVQVKGDGNIANQDGNDLDIYSRNAWDLKEESWIGTGEFPNDSYLGLRFPDVKLNPKANILSAKLVFTNTHGEDQWISTSFDAYGEVSPCSGVFTSSYLISKRARTFAKTSYNDDYKWKKGEKWEIGVTNILKEMQATGNLHDTISFIIKGTGTQWGRKFFINHRGSTADLPYLEVTYQE